MLYTNICIHVYKHMYNVLQADSKTRTPRCLLERTRDLALFGSHIPSVAIVPITSYTSHIPQNDVEKLVRPLDMFIYRHIHIHTYIYMYRERERERQRETERLRSLSIRSLSCCQMPSGELHSGGL